MVIKFDRIYLKKLSLINFKTKTFNILVQKRRNTLSSYCNKLNSETPIGLIEKYTSLFLQHNTEPRAREKEKIECGRGGGSSPTGLNHTIKIGKCNI